jgi:hypothetical protein
MKNWLLGVARAIMIVFFSGSLILLIYNSEPLLDIRTYGSNISTVSVAINVIALVALIWLFKKEKISFRSILVRGLGALFLMAFSLF